MSVRPSDRTEQLVSHWMDSRKNRNLRIFRKSVEIIQVSLKSDRIRDSLREGTRTFMTISKHALYVQSFLSPENRAVCEITCKKVQNACHCNKDYENMPPCYIIVH